MQNIRIAASYLKRELSQVFGRPDVFKEILPVTLIIWYSQKTMLAVGHKISEKRESILIDFKTDHHSIVTEVISRMNLENERIIFQWNQTLVEGHRIKDSDFMLPHDRKDAPHLKGKVHFTSDGVLTFCRLEQGRRISRIKDEVTCKSCQNKLSIDI